MYSIDERIIEQQILLIAKRRDCVQRMRMTLDPDELWALGQIEHELCVAIDKAFPTDHWWWYKQLQQGDAHA